MGFGESILRRGTGAWRVWSHRSEKGTMVEEIGGYG